MINISIKDVAEKRTDGLCCQISFECLVADMTMSAGEKQNEIGTYIVTRYTLVSSTNPVGQLKLRR